MNNSSKSKTFVIALLAFSVLGLGVLAWRQYDELAGLRSSKLSAKDLAAANARAFDAEKRIKELEAQLALAKATPVETPAPAGRGGRNGTAATAENAAPGGRGQGGPGGRGANNAELQAILQTPEALRLTATAAKANISLQYAALFRNLGLPGEQVDRITSLMADRQSVQQDVLSAAQAAGLATDPQALRELVQTEQARIDDQIRLAMGETAYSQYQAYQQSLPRRQEVASYQQQLTLAGVPMDASQVEALVAALGPTTGGAQGGGGGRGGALAFGGGGRGGGGGPGGVQNISANNLTAAAGVLNTSQLQVLQTTAQSQQAQQSLGQLTAAARGGQQRGGAAPAAATTAPATRANRGGN